MDNLCDEVFEANHTLAAWSTSLRTLSNNGSAWLGLIRRQLGRPKGLNGLPRTLFVVA
jgi:hypothetical protein